MTVFRPIADDHPALLQSPLVRALSHTLTYLSEHGGIPLTPSKAFKRVFVHWAAKAFDWPGYTETDLFHLNKVLNEIDFPPLMELHDLMLSLKIGRHFRGEFRLTKVGRSLIGHRAQMFATIVPSYLINAAHERHSRFGDTAIPGNWDIFLNVLNVEAEGGASGADLRRVLYGEPEATGIFDPMISGLYVQVLRPLCWSGLLQKTDTAGRYGTSEAMFAKTPLWSAALKLDTDDLVDIQTRH